MDEFTSDKPPKARKTSEKGLAAIKAWKIKNPDKHRAYCRKPALAWKYRNLEKARENNKECATRKRVAKYLEEALQMIREQGMLDINNQRQHALQKSGLWEDLMANVAATGARFDGPKTVPVFSTVDCCH